MTELQTEHLTKVRVILYSYKGHKAPLGQLVRMNGSPDKDACADKMLYVWVGRPCKPDDSWVCGTDLMWPIRKVQGAELLETPYFCRHMIEIGD